MRPRPPKVVQDVGVGAARVLQGVGQDAQPPLVQFAAGQVAFVVGRLGEVGDGAAVPAEPGGIDGDGAEGIAEDASE